jgi:hypothetical protein
MGLNLNVFFRVFPLPSSNAVGGASEAAAVPNVVFGRLEEGGHIMDRLRRVHIKKRLVPTIQLSVLAERIETRLVHAWSDATWSSYGSTFLNFAYYQERLPCGIPNHWALLLFLEESMDPSPEAVARGVTKISKRTAHQYSRRITSVFHQLKISWEHDWIKTYRQGLRREGGDGDVDQAVPFTTEEFYRWHDSLRRRGIS